jgi:hypothetical protein
MNDTKRRLCESVRNYVLLFVMTYFSDIPIQISPPLVSTETGDIQVKSVPCVQQVPMLYGRRSECHSCEYEILWRLRCSDICQ